MSLFLQQKDIVTSLNYFELIPCSGSEAVFVETDEGILYCDLPQGFRIRQTHSSSNIGCPHQDRHSLYSFYLNIAENATVRYPGLQGLFRKLAAENKFDCSFCEKKASLVKETFLFFQSGEYPQITLSCIAAFYDHPVAEGTDLKQILVPHVRSFHIIFQQVRSPKLRDVILEKVRKVLDEIGSQVHSALEENDDEALDNASFYFKKTLSQTIDEVCPFVSLKKIKFKDWLLSLILFQTNQNPPCIQDRGPFRSLKKAITLLYLFFHEKRSMTYIDRMYLEEMDHGRSQIQTDKTFLDRVHPFLRGDYIQI